ncbi:MAG TPA: UDP-N-acetylmuramoyl-tripeptide--D-alanyl-D-alanine ligase [Bacteroidota bacterium]|nr:UDP-N-acetylmuramoyl-tripeptide--D-alanyl-D-alanine ligase [Bacteroidota bacterium]
MNLTIDDLFSIPHRSARNLVSGNRMSFSGVSTDTRSLRNGEVYFALPGEKFDGHDFVDEAFRKGAGCAVIAEHADDGRWNARPVLVVESTVAALGTLARRWRSKFTIPVVAVGGSNGKTTTKEMIARVLRKKYETLSTEGNLNNHLGVPKTLFRLTPEHEVAVIEVGTNHPGEITYLCEMLNPTHGMITNIGREHLEFFRTVEGVAAAEGELFRGMGKDATGFVNNDDEYVVDLAKRVRKKVTYGFTAKASSVSGKFLTMDDRGCAQFAVSPRGGRSYSVHLSVPGMHTMSNALAAAAVGMEFEVSPQDIRHALETFTAVGKRMEVLRAGNVTILNDTYNANPESVISALETLGGMNTRGKKIVVLADMLELGDTSPAEHVSLGKKVSAMGFGYLFTFGEMARRIHDAAAVPMKVHYDQKNVLAEFLVELVAPGDVVLVKGSRGMKMEDVVTFLVERLQRKPE